MDALKEINYFIKFLPKVEDKDAWLVNKQGNIKLNKKRRRNKKKSEVQRRIKKFLRK